MQDRIEAFLHYLSAERGASKNTIDAYRNDLGGFRKFIDAGGAAPAPLASGDDSSEDGAGTAGGAGSESPITQVVTPQTITGYIGDLNDRRYAKATVARKVAAVKSFCAFLLDSGDLQSNPATQVDSPRAPKP
ncbi:MAG: site-specific integrase, partial [Dehalococcoidia bacterium]|nr:site-specific integrase [Dehalococcoidia bacterium]